MFSKEFRHYIAAIFLNFFLKVLPDCGFMNLIYLDQNIPDVLLYFIGDNAYLVIMDYSF